MKRTTFAAAALFASATLAAPSANNFHAVTNDWYQGNWTNVYELAQTRLAANSNDVVGAYIMLEWDCSFSDNATTAASVTRMLSACRTITLPAFTNECAAVHDAWIHYRDVFLPSYSEQERLSELHKSYFKHQRMTCDMILKILWDNNLW